MALVGGVLSRLPAPEDVREALLSSEAPNVARRRGIVGASLVGMAAMAAVSLLQTGVVHHLPDPPIRGFDSDKVNLGRTAFQFGAPDGTFAAASLAMNLPLAAFGATRRAETHPWISVAAAAKAGVDAAAAGWYFYQMPTKENAWCGYCILGALANAAVFALTVPEARQAASVLLRRCSRP